MHDGDDSSDSDSDPDTAGPEDVPDEPPAVDSGEAPEDVLDEPPAVYSGEPQVPAVYYTGSDGHLYGCDDSSSDSESDSGEPHFVEGNPVILHGLKRMDLNGKKGIVQGPLDPAKQRYPVSVGGQKLALRPCNLRLAASTPVDSDGVQKAPPGGGPEDVQHLVHQHLTLSEDAKGFESVVVTHPIARAAVLMDELPLVCVPVGNLEDHCHHCLTEPRAAEAAHGTYACTSCGLVAHFCSAGCKAAFRGVHDGLECELRGSLDIKCDEGSDTRELRMGIRWLAGPDPLGVTKLPGSAPLSEAQTQEFTGYSEALALALGHLSPDLLAALTGGEATILHFFRVLACSEPPVKSPQTGRVVGGALYTGASAFNHSCRPNAVASIGRHGRFCAAAAAPWQPVWKSRWRTNPTCTAPCHTRHRILPQPPPPPQDVP